MRSVHTLTVRPQIKGLKFADGSNTENAERRDMNQSTAIDSRYFLRLY